MNNQKSIYSYLGISFNGGGSFVKCIGTHISYGVGKSFVGKYHSLYVMSRGLIIISTSVMDWLSVHLGGGHIHWLFPLDFSSFSIPRHTAELSIVKLKQNTVKLNVL